MKVLVITNLFPNSKEPQRATFNYQQIAELAELCELTVVAPISWIQKLKNIIKFKKLIRYKVVDSKVNAFYPSYFYTPSVLRCVYGVFYFLSIFYKTLRLVNKNKPDVLLGTWAYPDGFATVLYGKLFRLPVVIKVHGTDIHSVNSTCRRYITSWVLTRADKVISVSQGLADTMSDEFSVASNNIEVIKNGIDENVFYPIEKAIAKSEIPLLDSDTKILLFIGNLKPEKNPLILLDAFYELVRKLDASEKIQLHYIGDGPLNSELQLKITNHHLRDIVFMHGSVAHEKIPLWLNAADVLVLPSNNEGMPNVVLEALACHTPVVATKVGGIPEVIDEGVTGYMLSQLDVNLLANKLNDAIGNNWRPSDFENNSNIQTWKSTARDIKKVLEAEF